MIAHQDLRTLGIAHIDCDSFYASVEKRDQPDLKDKPLLIGGTHRRAVVSTACYLARAYGCRSAMPMYKAKRLCPNATIIPPDIAKYKQVSHEINIIFQKYTDIVQAVALDEAYLDLRHRDDIPEVLSDIALQIEHDIGITVSIGLSYCKFLAKLASELGKPRGFAVIGPMEAWTFLASRPVRDIIGVGPAMEQRLIRDGFVTIGDIQRTTEIEFKIRYGQHGREIWQLARGNDNRPIHFKRELKSISSETTFETDIADLESLLIALQPLAKKVEERMRRAGVAATIAQLKLKTSHFHLLTRQIRLPAPTQRADVLLSSVAPLIRRESNGLQFRLVGIGGECLVSADHADLPDLFQKF